MIAVVNGWAVPLSVPNGHFDLVGDWWYDASPVTFNTEACANENTYDGWVCNCGSYQFELTPEGARCLGCRTYATGWVE